MCPSGRKRACGKMTVKEFYLSLCESYKAALSAEWDNDGLMCCPDESKEVKRVLCALDATEEIIDYAAGNGFDVILTHHPLVFHKLPALSPEIPEAKKLIKLLSAGISVLSFHTRADAADGGVNDLLAAALSLSNVEALGDIGRMGTLKAPMQLSDFASLVKARLGAPLVLLGDAGRPVHKIGLCGGSGKDEIGAAIAAGCDSFLSGRLSYESVNEAASFGLNLIEAGHFYTEDLLPRHWAKTLPKRYSGLKAEYKSSFQIEIH